MRLFAIICSVIFACYAICFTTGCAAGLSPAPGINFGFSAQPGSVGVGVDLNPISAGCEMAKLISWNWAENSLCPKVPNPIIPRVDENPATTPQFETHASQPGESTFIIN